MAGSINSQYYQHGQMGTHAINIRERQTQEGIVSHLLTNFVPNMSNQFMTLINFV